MKLKGEAAIISGAGRGLSRTIAESYARAGASLALTAASEKRA
jgi:NAD(P)-dependent dehydrogenase (short-subunit alcohol dehydrogenase family)